MSRKKKGTDKRMQRRILRTLRRALDARAPTSQRVGEVGKFWGSVVITLVVGGFAALGLGMFENHRSREGERLRLLSEAEDARRHALGEFGARIHTVVEALYAAHRAEELWRDESQHLEVDEADRIVKETTLPFAMKLVDSAPAARLAERLYADFLVKRDAAMRAGSGQAVCVALMSRLRTHEARVAVSALSEAVLELENGIEPAAVGPVAPDPPRARLATTRRDATAQAVSCMDSRLTRDRLDAIDALVQRVSDELDNAYKEIRHELAHDSRSLWSDAAVDGSHRRFDRHPDDGRMHEERRAPHAATAPEGIGGADA
jgi:hypothetical protein